MCPFRWPSAPFPERRAEAKPTTFISVFYLLLSIYAQHVLFPSKRCLSHPSFPDALGLDWLESRHEANLW